MRNRTYIKDLIESLTEAEKARLRAYYDTAEEGYVTFHVSVFNAGYTVTISIAAEPQDFNPDEWNGYDIHDMPIEDVISLMEEYCL